MRKDDLPSVVRIERETFPVPWSLDNFRHEIEANPYACNRVLRSPEGEVEGYANAWIVGDEFRINNLAVRVESRRRGLGRRMMDHLLGVARRGGCLRATLEVRPTNLPALALYRELGFRVVGRRRSYYSDTGEDALVMEARL